MAVDGRSTLVPLLALLLCGLAAGCVTSSNGSVVAVPVADLRAEPGSHLAAGTHDPLQETQLLYGERVHVRARRDGWAQIEAPDQPEHTHHQRWEGYPGWVKEDALRQSAWKPDAVVGVRWASVWDNAFAGGTALMHLPMGAALEVADSNGALQQVRLIDGRGGWVSPGDIHRHADLQRLSDEEQRQLVLRAAGALLGDAYVWGGRSPGDPTGLAVTGVDCSGLVNLAYRTAGITVPRDAHEQRLRARPVTVLQPADLIFLSSPDDPAKAVHVILYAGDGWLIEGPGTGQAIRRISTQERLGLSPGQLVDGARAGGQTIYLGTYFSD